MKNIKNILYIQTGSGIGDALSQVCIFNLINTYIKPKKIYYYSTDLRKFWFDNLLLEFKPSNLKVIKSFPEHFGFQKKDKNIAKNLIKHFPFKQFDLIIDNQTRFKNTMLYRMIPHKYFISPSLNYFFCKPFFFIKKSKHVCLRIKNYFEKILKRKIDLNFNINIPKEIINLVKKKFNNNEKYIGFSITQGHPSRDKSFNLDEILKVANHYSEKYTPVFFIEKKYSNLIKLIKKKVKKAYFPEIDVKKNYQKPMLVSCMSSNMEFSVSINNGAAHMLSFNAKKLFIFYDENSVKFLPPKKNCYAYDCKVKNTKMNKLTKNDIIEFIENKLF